MLIMCTPTLIITCGLIAAVSFGACAFCAPFRFIQLHHLSTRVENVFKVNAAHRNQEQHNQFKRNTPKPRAVQPDQFATQSNQEQYNQTQEGSLVTERIQSDRLLAFIVICRHQGTQLKSRRHTCERLHPCQLQG